MLSVNANTTIEHWYGVDMQEHGWSAGPATHLVRRIFGVLTTDTKR